MFHNRDRQKASLSAGAASGECVVAHFDFSIEAKELTVATIMWWS